MIEVLLEGTRARSWRNALLEDVATSSEVLSQFRNQAALLDPNTAATLTSPISIATPGRVTWMFGEAPDGLVTDIAATGAHYEARPVDAMADLIRAQRVALERARRAGLDPDSPRNLSRSVILDS